MRDPRDDTREYWVQQEYNEYALGALQDEEESNDSGEA
jgi:hypothetical protein